MQLPLTINAIEDLPEAIRGIAQEHDFYASTTEGEKTVLRLNLDDKNDTRVAGLIGKKNELLAKVKQMQTQLVAFDGVDITEAKHAIEQLPKLQEKLKNGSQKVDVESIRVELKAEFDRQIETERAEKLAIKGAAIDGTLDTAINHAFDVHKVLPGAPRDLLRTHVKSQLTVEEQKAEDKIIFCSRVKNAGNPNVPYRVSSNEKGDGFMTVEELVGGLKEQQDYGFAFQGSQATGGGSTNEGGGGKAPNTSVQYKEDLSTIKAQSDFITKHGSNAYLDLPNRPPN